ncbi:hypothetical protein [Trinickia dinghuensis]|nr:hypothetical protein [Trinickia dinghuensis]
MTVSSTSSTSMNSGDIEAQMNNMQTQEEDFQLWSMQLSNTQDMCKTEMSARQGESSTVDTACQSMQRGAHVS